VKAWERGRGSNVLSGSRETKMEGGGSAWD
jgi:hypothetical protein